jgi:hypothetical protein
MYCCIILCCMPYFGASPSRGYIKKQYVPRLTKEHMALDSSVNRGMYGHGAGARARGLGGWGGSLVHSLVMCNRGIYFTIFVG